MGSSEFKELSARLDRIERVALLSVKSALDINDASVLTGMTVQSLYRMTSEKRIPHYKRGTRLYFKKEDLEAWMLDERIKTDEEIQAEASSLIIKNKYKTTSR